MLTTKDSTQIFAVNEAVATFATQRQVVAPCGGMENVNGNIAYAGGAPTSAPLIEFSRDGTNWDAAQTSGLDPQAAAGITGYSWSIQIESWLFVRLTVQPPVGSCRGAAKVDPRLGIY